MKLLAVSQDAKTPKGEKLGYLTGILYLAPAGESGVMDVCPKATAGCRAGCLFTAGQASIFRNINRARVRKTRWFKSDPEGFKAALRADIRALVRKAERKGLVPCVRVNGTSDLPKLAREMALAFPDVMFYDYTKIPRPWERELANYHLTFSLSERNELDAIATLQKGRNVAVVFHTRKGQPLPESWRGFPVVDGDSSDLRFLDRHRLGLVIGLRAKGRARKDTSGFVQLLQLPSFQPKLGDLAYVLR